MSNLDTSPLAVGRLRNAPNRIHQGFFCHLVVFYPLQELRYNPFQGTFEDDFFFFPRWDMLVSWRVIFCFWRIFFSSTPPKTNIRTFKIIVSKKRNPHFPGVKHFQVQHVKIFRVAYNSCSNILHTFLHLAKRSGFR